MRDSKSKSQRDATLGLLCLKVGSGITPRGGASVYVGSGTALIRSQNVYNADFAYDGLAFITDRTAEVMKGVSIESGDILLNITGDSVARCCQVPDDVLPARVNQHVSIIRPDQSKLHPRFLMYYLVSPSMQATMLSLAGSGGTRKALTKTMIERFQIPLLDLSEQRKIAGMLSAYDELIENNRRRIALLEQAARELYQEWFVRLRFPGHESTKIVDGVPEGWERVLLSDLVSTQYGFTASAIEEPIGPRFLRGKDINKNSYIDWDTVPYCPMSNLRVEKYTLRPGDLLVVRMADPGKVAIVEKEIQAVFASYLVRLVIRDRQKNLPGYLFYVLSDSEYQGFIGAASGGSTRRSASAKLLTEFRVVQPPNVVQGLFMDHVAPLRKMIGTLLDQNAQARASRDLLLPRLMSGAVAV